MIDRALGIVGVALALLTGVVQYFFPQAPNWATLLGYGIGIFLLGFSAGLLAAGGLYRKRPVRSSASLRLHIFGDHRTPNQLTQENIFRWYYLQTMALNDITPQGKQLVAISSTLFVTFQEDVAIHTLTVHSPDMQLPLYEVKESTQRYAIISFSKNVPVGTLEINAHGN